MSSFAVEKKSINTKSGHWLVVKLQQTHDVARLGFTLRYEFSVKYLLVITEGTSNENTDWTQRCN